MPRTAFWKIQDVHCYTAVCSHQHHLCPSRKLRALPQLAARTQLSQTAVFSSAITPDSSPSKVWQGCQCVAINPITGQSPLPAEQQQDSWQQDVTCTGCHDFAVLPQTTAEVHNASAIAGLAAAEPGDPWTHASPQHTACAVRPLGFTPAAAATGLTLRLRSNMVSRLRATCTPIGAAAGQLCNSAGKQEEHTAGCWQLGHT